MQRKSQVTLQNKFWYVVENFNAVFHSFYTIQMYFEFLKDYRISAAYVLMKIDFIKLCISGASS